MATMFERVEATSPAFALAELRSRFPEGARDVRTVCVPSPGDLFREPPRAVAWLVEDEALDAVLDRLAPPGFRPTGHSVEVYGLCDRCQRKRTPRAAAGPGSSQGNEHNHTH